MLPVNAAVFACRALLVMHVLALVFELRIGAVTVMRLLSNMRHPDRQASPEAIDAQRVQVVATGVPLGTTLVTFVLTMVGEGDAVQGLKTIGTRISVVGRSISIAGQRLGTGRQRLSSMGHKISEAGSFVSRKLSSTGQRSDRRSYTPFETDGNELLLLPYASDPACAD